MAQSYPSPCEKCTSTSCNRGGTGCPEWRKRYRYRQKQINAYAKRAFDNRREPPADKDTHFCYAHPNDVRRYLYTSPCKGCGLANNCDTPCGAYLEWYDTRMEVFRRIFT